MAVINTQYSTLEEAWGTEKPTKMKQRECDLYEKSKKGILRRPHRQNTDKELSHKNMMLLDDEAMDNEDYERYHGYSDSRKFSRTSKPLKKHKERSSKKQKSKKRVTIDPNLNSYYEPEEELPRALRPRKITDVEEEDYIYEEVFDEDEDNYLTQGVREDRDITSGFITRKDFIDEEDDQDDYFDIEDEAIEEEDESFKRRRKHASSAKKVVKHQNSVDHRQLLDLTIYTMSGIILIFMMEQFVEIGIKIKGYN